MKYPPLPDPEPPAPGPQAAREPPPPPPPPPAEGGSSGDVGAETPIYAAPPAPESDDDDTDRDLLDETVRDEATDDEFAELIERVDLDDLEDLENLEDVADLDDEDDDDAVEVPTLTEEPEAAPEPEPVLGPEPGELPADAGAIARHRIGGDEPIPMLTEVVQVPRYDSEELPQSLAEVDWGDLAQRVRENVLERLLRRSDALLDAQLQDTLVPVLERAAETVAHELHDALNRMIRDIVARAVTEELTRLHAEIAKRNRSRPR